MGRGRKSSTPLDKIIKRLPYGAKDALDDMDEEALSAEIVRRAGDLDDVREAERADTELTEAKAHVKELAASYKESRQQIQARISYALHRRAQIGVSVRLAKSA